MAHLSALAESEATAAAQMAGELAELIDVATDAFDLVGLLLTRLTIPTSGPTLPAVFAMACLGTRLANDLHCAERLAAAGYPAQAGTIVSSMYE